MSKEAAAWCFSNEEGCLIPRCMTSHPKIDAMYLIWGSVFLRTEIHRKKIQRGFPYSVEGGKLGRRL